MTFPFPGEPTPENLKRYSKAMERFKSYEDKADEFDNRFGEGYYTVVLDEGNECYHSEEIKLFISQLLRTALQQQKVANRDSLQQRIGMLRQWLNEDRITDVDRMVTNQQLERWLLDDLS